MCGTFLANAILTLLAWLSGMIHAFIINSKA
ncbi:YqaE/Pmp3 family membrane protein [Kordia zhangzhouensis]|nr:YqaE/Pmp3 family membrane protein [Kordia zhangzhouensis]